jgi:hypothetical protein
MADAPPDVVIDREYLSQFSRPTFGLIIHKDGVPDDPDANTVSVIMEASDGTVIFERDATREDLGDFKVTLSSMETKAPDNYNLTWTYSLDTVPQMYQSYLQVGPAAPMYDDLDSDFKLVIEQVWFRFADCFDSPYGGPFLTTLFQTAMNRQRMAQLLRASVQYLNTISQPHFVYTIDGPGNLFPVSAWGGLLEAGLYIEIIKHLRRSYVEQPVVAGAGSITILDRRDYLQRWGEILADETDSYKRMLDNFKIANMGLGRPAVLLSGGVYGSYGPSRLPGSAAARPRYYYSFA